MSAKKGSQASSVVVGGAKKNRVGPRMRLTILLASGLVLVAVVGIGGWLVYEHSSDGSKTTKTSKIPEAAQKTTEINGQPVTQTQRSQQAIYYGEYDQGQQILKDQLSSAKTSDEKITLYRQLAGNALNAKKYDEANSYLQTALKLKKTPGVYSLLAQTAAAQGDKKKALEYANQEKQLITDTKPPGYQMQIRGVDKYIEGLQN